MSQDSIYRLTYVQALNDVRFSNVIAFQQTSPNGANDPRKDLADAFLAAVSQQLLFRLSDQWSDRCLQVREVGMVGQDFWRQLSANVGDQSVEPLPSEVCAQLKMFTGTAGRGMTGRMFFSGIPVTQEEDNCLLEDYMATWSQVITNLSTPITDTGATFHAGLLRGNGDFLPFESGVIKSPLTVQRSRKQPIIC